MSAIENALDDDLFGLAEKQIWHSLSVERSAEEKTELSVLLARSLIGQKRFDDAIILCEESARLLKPEAFIYWEARAFFEAGEPDAMFETLKNLPKNSPYAPAALRMEGHAALLHDEVKAAENYFVQFEERFPNHEDAAQNLLDLANVNLQLDREQTVVKTLGKLLERFPEQVESDSARLLLARQLLTKDGNNERKQAAELLARLGSTETAMPRLRIAAWVELAALQKKTGRPADAANSLLKAENLTAENVVRVRQKAARANLLIEEGNAKQALALFDEAIQTAGDEELATEILVQKAEALLDNGQYAAAETAFQACLNVTEKIPLQVRALLGKGWSLWDQKRFEESAIAFEQAAAKCMNPAQCVVARVKAGDGRFAAGQYKQANENYQSALKIDPGHPLAARATYQSGLSLLKTGALEQARQQFHLAETDFPDGPFAPLAALQQADLLKQENQSEAALQDYIRIESQYTNAVTRAIALHQQGLILFQFKRYAEAFDVFDAVTKECPKAEQAAQAAYMRGFCRYLQGSTDEAMAIFEEYVNKFPDSPWTPSVFFLIGEHAYNRGDYAQAQTAFLDLTENFPKHELADDALFWAGNALLRQNRFLDAFSMYSRLAKEYPQSELLLKTRFAQGEALTELGEFPRAILAYEEIIKANPDSSLADQARGRLGDCLFTLGATEAGRYQEALDAYLAIYKRPGTSFAFKLQALCKIGRCEEKIGRIDKAFAHYMEAVYSLDELNEPLSPEMALWFTRSAFEAAAMQELQQNWKTAVNIYERVVAANVPAGNEAQKRIEQLRNEHADFF